MGSVHLHVTRGRGETSRPQQGDPCRSMAATPRGGRLMDRHTLEQEALTIARSIDIADKSEQYHLAGARRDHNRKDTLELRLDEIRTQLLTADDGRCDCPA